MGQIGFQVGEQRPALLCVIIYQLQYRRMTEGFQTLRFFLSVRDNGDIMILKSAQTSSRITVRNSHLALNIGVFQVTEIVEDAT